VNFSCDELNSETNWVLDIGQAFDILSKVLGKYNLKNLDEVFSNKELTTTEFMAHQIHNDLCKHLKELGFSGDMCVKLWESHNAWASYEGPVNEEQ